MYVFRSDRFDDQAERLGVEDRHRIERAISDMENAPAPHLSGSPFKQVPPYYYRREGIVRPIARVKEVDGENIFCLLDIIWRRDSNTYSSFGDDPRGYGENYLEPLISYEEVSGWLKKRKTEEAEEGRVQGLPTVPPSLCAWLEPPKLSVAAVEDGDATGELVIYEGKDWVDQFHREEIQRYWERYYKRIVEIIDENDEPEDELRAFTDRDWIHVSQGEGRFVVYAIVQITGVRSRPVLFLLFAGEGSPDKQTFTKLYENNKELFSLLDSYTSIETELLTPFAVRSYPERILYDDACWYAIQKEKETNLALSPEEESLLDMVSFSQNKESSLPLFINGRAGSGKSTMLYYIFAEYCYQKWQENNGQDMQGRLLFLTYNERLLDTASKSVLALLTSHHRYLSKRGAVTAKQSADLEKRIREYFHPFREFLLESLIGHESSTGTAGGNDGTSNLVATKDLADCFDEAKHISFFRFKQLFEGKSFDNMASPLRVKVPRTLSPELCWYAIRTYIKGYDSSDYLDPDDYMFVPRKERTVSIDLFRDVFNKVFEPWYQTLTKDGGYWDDQDLIRTVLKYKLSAPDYAVIFCDEAQDFTRIENQLIMQLSVFSKYDIRGMYSAALPFAFAGDPFQTLNPTGFRWSSIQSTFHDEVIAPLDPTQRCNISLNYRELSINYRSKAPIVKLNNLIQLWRSLLFGFKELRPQQWWAQEQHPPPEKFILGKHISEEDFRELITDTIIIVPCEEGQEVEYVSNDPVLSGLFPNPKNILSAIAAKGLEFDRVVLYKFGEACSKAVWDLLDEPSENTYEYEYFFNKLYVAASRAMKHLYIVDSEEGDANLWWRSSRKTEIDECLVRVADIKEWNSDVVDVLHSGTKISAKGMVEDMPQKIAEEFKNKGMSSRNPILLRKASSYYADRRESRICEAWALCFEGDFSGAGLSFLELGEPEEARQCFWDGLLWAELDGWYEKHEEVAYSDEAREIARFMMQSREDLRAIIDFTGFLQESVEKSTIGPSSQKQWKTAVLELTHRLQGLPWEKLEEEKWQEVAELLVALHEKRYPRALNVLAGKCYYLLKDFQRAVECWESSGETNTEEYNRAKANVLGPPRSLEYLERAGDDDAILQEWDDAIGMDVKSESRWLRFVGPALEKTGRFFEAFELYIRASSDDGIQRMVKELRRDSSCDFASVIQILVLYNMERKRWLEAIDAFNNNLKDVPRDENKRSLLHAAFTKEIAYSELTDQNLDRNILKRFEREIQVAINDPVAIEELSVQEIGAALERTGELKSTLVFYEGYTESRDREISFFAQKRWAHVKKKQLSYLRKRGQMPAANNEAKNRERRLTDWGYGREMPGIEPEFPVLDRKKPLGDLVKGLPRTATFKQRNDGSYEVEISNLEVRVFRDQSVVMITDSKDATVIRIDLVSETVTGRDDIEVERRPGKKELSFSVPRGNFRGLALLGDKYKLTLHIKGQRHPIEFSL